jgi:hypothetical protein
LKQQNQKKKKKKPEIYHKGSSLGEEGEERLTLKAVNLSLLQTHPPHPSSSLVIIKFNYLVWICTIVRGMTNVIVSALYLILLQYLIKDIIGLPIVLTLLHIPLKN